MVTRSSCASNKDGSINANYNECRYGIDNICISRTKDSKLNGISSIDFHAFLSH
jgi:hypothetical protein